VEQRSLISHSELSSQERRGSGGGLILLHTRPRANGGGPCSFRGCPNTTPQGRVLTLIVLVTRRLKGSSASDVCLTYLYKRPGWIEVGFRDLVVFFGPRSAPDDPADLTEVQRVTAVATMRDTPVVLFNPRFFSYSKFLG
jgi:hypothetical protein